MASTDFQKPSTGVAKEATKEKNATKTTPAIPQQTSKIKGHKVSSNELMTSVLGKAVSGLSTGVSTKLASGIFGTGAQDQLISQDIYGKDNSDIINTFTDRLKDAAGGLLGGSKSSIVSDLLNIAKSSGGKLDLGSMTDRIAKEMSGGSGILNQLTAGVKDKLTGQLGVSSDLFDKMKVTLGNLSSGYQNGDLNSARGIFDLMGRFCGDSDLFKMVDLGAQTNLLSGLIDQAMSFGFSDAIDRLIDSSQDSKVTTISLENNIRTAVERADLTAINIIADNIGALRITSRSPEAVVTILARYRIPAGKKDTDYPTLWTALKETLDRIDPHWLTVERNGESLLNLASFRNASDDVKKIAGNDPQIGVLLMIAKDYPSVNLMDALKKQYPLLAA